MDLALRAIRGGRGQGRGHRRSKHRAVHDVERSRSPPGRIITTTDWLAAIMQDWKHLANAPAELRSDPELVGEAMRESAGEALRCAAEELRSDKEFVLGAAQEIGASVLAYASDDLRIDREFVMEVVDFCPPGEVLQHVSGDVRTELLSDREFVLQAVQDIGLEMMEDVPLELRGEREFILAVADYCPPGEALQYATPELRAQLYSDRAFMLDAIKAIGVEVLEDASPELRRDHSFMTEASKWCSYDELMQYSLPEQCSQVSFDSVPAQQSDADHTDSWHEDLVQKSHDPKFAAPVPKFAPSQNSAPRPPQPAKLPMPAYNMSPAGLSGAQRPPQHLETSRPTAQCPAPALNVSLPPVQLVQSNGFGAQLQQPPQPEALNFAPPGMRTDFRSALAAAPPMAQAPPPLASPLAPVAISGPSFPTAAAPQVMQLPPMPTGVLGTPAAMAFCPPQPLGLMTMGSAPTLPCTAPSLAGPVTPGAPLQPIAPAMEVAGATTAGSHPNSCTPWTNAAQPLPSAADGTVSAATTAVTPGNLAAERTPAVAVEMVESSDDEATPQTAAGTRSKEERAKLLQQVKAAGAASLASLSMDLRGDREFMLAAADNSTIVEILPHTSPKLREEFSKDRDILSRALRESGAVALESACAEIRNDRDFMADAMARHPEALRFAPAKLRTELYGDRTFVLRAVKEGGVQALGRAAANLRGDREFMLQAAACCPQALRYASAKLRTELYADQAFMLKAVRGVGAKALERASAALRSDREFMLEASAFCKKMDVLRHASDQLRKELYADRDFVLKAIHEVGACVLEHVSQELRSDLGFMIEVMGACAPGEVLPYVSEELRAELDADD